MFRLESINLTIFRKFPTRMKKNLSIKAKTKNSAFWSSASIKEQLDREILQTARDMLDKIFYFTKSGNSQNVSFSKNCWKFR